MRLRDGTSTQDPRLDRLPAFDALASLLDAQGEACIPVVRNRERTVA